MSQSPIRVLLIEDTEAFALLVHDTLKAKNKDILVESVDRISDAAESLAQQTFDAIVLDLTLPDAKGLEAVTAVHSIAPGTPIIVLTGSERGSVESGALARGASALIEKIHYTGTDLHETICRLVDDMARPVEECIKKMEEHARL